MFEATLTICVLSDLMTTSEELEFVSGQSVKADWTARV